MTCHTAPGGPPSAGAYRLEKPLGALLAPNITPDTATGIGRWSADEFCRTPHQGANRRGQDMYPAMPCDFCTRVAPGDSDALHCSAGQAPRNALGGIEKDQAFTGATIDGWFAFDLSSNLHTGQGGWSAAETATYLQTGAVAAPDPANILKVVLDGVPQQGKDIPMPAFDAPPSDAQFADLANDVRTSWGNAAAPNATPAGVATPRASTRWHVRGRQRRPRSSRRPAPCKA